MFCEDGQVSNIAYEGTLEIDFVPERMEIVGVTDRVVFYDVLAHHLNFPLKSLIPHELARLALDSYKSSMAASAEISDWLRQW